MQAFSTFSWYTYLTPQQQSLALSTEELLKAANSGAVVCPDYSFVIFPLAKTYEGFLKKLLLELRLISEEAYYSKRFRIGRALNPDVHMDQRDRFWLFDDIVRTCGQEHAQQIWETWLECRNRVFHAFPKNESLCSLEKANDCVRILVETMQDTMSCAPQQTQGE